MKGNASLETGKNTSHLLVFFSLAFGWSWTFWTIAVLSGLAMDTAGGALLALGGLFGPITAGVSCTFLTFGTAGLRDFRARLLDPGRIGIRWLAVAFLLAPTVVIVAGVIDIVAGGRGIAWGEPALVFFASPWTIVPFVFGTFFTGPMEEFGWRGYALDRLQAKLNVLGAGVILGLAWSLWHLPLFFLRGSYQFSLGAWSPAFWMFMTAIVPLSVVFSWLYNNTDRSILAAMFLHFSVNFTGELVDLTARAEMLAVLLWTALAVCTTFSGGCGTSAKRGALTQ